MNLNPREIKLLVAAGSIIAVCIIYVFLVEPSMKRYSHELMLIGERQQTIAALEKELKQEDAINIKYAQAMNNLKDDRERKMTPQKLFAMVEQISAPSGVSIRSVDPLPVEQHDYYDVIAIRIVVESDISELVLLLDSFSENTGGIKMGRVAISPIEPGKPDLTSQIQISTTMLHEKEKSLQ